MKKYIIISILTFIIFNCHLSIVNCQSWKEMMDSSRYFQQKSDFYKAIDFGLKSLESAKKEFGDIDTNVAEIAHRLTFLYWSIGKYEVALDYAKLDSSITVRTVGKNNVMYASTSLNLGAQYIQLGYYDLAEKSYKESLEINRNLFKEDNPELAISIMNLGYFYEDRGNYNAAEPLLQEGFEMHKRYYKQDHYNLARVLNNMASYYSTIGNYKEAEPLYKEALAMNRRISKGDNPALASSIRNMALHYENRGDFSEAEPLFKESLDMSRRIYKGDSPKLSMFISSLSTFYSKTGNYKAAEPLLKEALEMNRRMYKRDHPDLALSLINAGVFYTNLDSLKVAEQYYKDGLEMYRRLFKNDQPDLANAIYSIAGFFERIDKTEAAEKLFKEALEMRRRLYKKDNLYLGLNILEMARIYEKTGKFSDADSLYKEAVDMFSRIYNGNHKTLAFALYNKALFEESTGNHSEAESLFRECLQVYNNVINNYFPSLSQTEKKIFWFTINGFFEAFNSFAIDRYFENPLIISNMYDNQLQTKALLFNSESNIKSRIFSSKDSVLINKYELWKDKSEFLVKLYKMSSEELHKKNFKLDSIEKIANELEKEISLLSEKFAKSYEKKKVNWKAIQTLLKPDEAAVEVIRFRYFHKRRFTDTICYAFLIVTDKTEEYPELVIFNNGVELENEFYNSYLSSIKKKQKDIYSFSRYWGKLFEKLKNYKKIYFSADGIYNKLNPSTLLMPDGQYLLDVYDIQQINSTKDILLGFYKAKQETNIFNNAVLIGNPNFSLSGDKIREVSKIIKGSTESERGAEEVNKIRGLLLTKLPGTEKEITDIDKFLKSKSWVVNSYLGDLAIKSAVKSAKSPRILHIATHGLFLEDVKTAGKEIFGFEEQKMTENPLLRSGLFFSGADNLLSNNSTNFEEEDNGLLTAYEAMNLELDKTELVVLSACETGLGEVQNGEGVFGLRRAFQQAGAKTVLMSLWRVSDEATQELMSDFYKYWISGMTKRESFSMAQQEIRQKFPEPYYWGAFVMVGE